MERASADSYVGPSLACAQISAHRPLGRNRRKLQSSVETNVIRPGQEIDSSDFLTSLSWSRFLDGERDSVTHKTQDQTVEKSEKMFQEFSFPLVPRSTFQSCFWFWLKARSRWDRELELTLRKRRWQERCPSWKVDRVLANQRLNLTAASQVASNVPKAYDLNLLKNHIWDSIRPQNQSSVWWSSPKVWRETFQDHKLEEI